MSPKPASPPKPVGDGAESALHRIAAALERVAPRPAPAADLAAADAWVWEPDQDRLRPVARVNRVPLPLLRGIDRARDTLLANTGRFASGLPANNALLWGARGMGKSSLVKAVHGEIAADAAAAPGLVEVQRDELAALPRLLRLLAESSRRWIVFCDDLSFEAGDAYRSLKGVLEGGLEGRPANVVLYATSNRRHILPREAIENEQSTALRPGEAVDEKVSLSDRFGLWLGFHPASQDEYLDMVRGYVAHFGLGSFDDEVRAAAAAWSVTRGARSGRVAWQFIQDLAGRRGQPLA